jgi:hypothetical protein
VQNVVPADLTLFATLAPSEPDGFLDKRELLYSVNLTSRLLNISRPRCQPQLFLIREMTGWTTQMRANTGLSLKII